MQQPTPRILAACKDMGGANILLPVVRRLRVEGFSTTLIGYKTSEAFFSEEGIEFNTISDFGLSQVNENSMDKLISKVKPSLVLVGTSGSKGIEKPLTWAARKRGIRSFAVLDFWSNYRKRFVIDSDKDFAKYAPDCLGVMSQFARKEAIASGFKPEQVVVVGQPHFDSLQLAKSSFKEKDAVAFKKSLNIPLEQKVVLFLSQRIEEMYGSRQKCEAALGFSQTGVTELLAKALESVGKGFVLVVKPHPAEDMQKFTGLKGIIAKDVGTRQAILSSDFVVGMDSITLFEALFFGKPVLSLQPNLKGNDKLNFNRRQVIPTICNEGLIKPRLKEFLSQKTALKDNRNFFIKALGVDGGATDRVVQQVNRMLTTVGAVVVTRMGSTRLPGKGMLPIEGKPVLWHVISRLKRCKQLNQIVVATTIKQEDKEILQLADKMGVKGFAGSSEDVLDRVSRAAKANGIDVVALIQGDCPLIDPVIVDLVIREHFKCRADYTSNVFSVEGDEVPLGFTVEVFSTKDLEQINKTVKDRFVHEHVTLYFVERPERYNLVRAVMPKQMLRPELRFVLDEWEDYQLISRVYAELYPRNKFFGVLDVMELMQRKPELARINCNIRQKTVRES